MHMLACVLSPFSFPHVHLSLLVRIELSSSVGRQRIGVSAVQSENFGRSRVGKKLERYFSRV